MLDVRSILLSDCFYFFSAESRAKNKNAKPKANNGILNCPFQSKMLAKNA